jgi:hypothetical protein
MSEDNRVVYRSSEQAQADYEDQRTKDYEEFEEFRKEKLRKAGIPVDDHILGSSLHPDTIKSYNELGMRPEDSPRLATLRPNERMKQRMSEVEGRPITVHTLIRSVARLLTEEGNEKMIVSRAEYFKDFNGNPRQLEYRADYVHEEVYGKKQRDSSYRVIGSTIEGKRNVYTQPWDKKLFLELMEKHKAAVKILKGEKWPVKVSFADPELLLGYAKSKGTTYATNESGKRLYSSKLSQTEYANAKVSEAYECGRRSLTSLKQLSQVR